jgi:hypothetical protein
MRLVQRGREDEIAAGLLHDFAAAEDDVAAVEVQDRFDQERTAQRFTGLLVCAIHRCRRPVAVVGECLVVRGGRGDAVDGPQLLRARELAVGDLRGHSGQRGNGEADGVRVGPPDIEVVPRLVGLAPIEPGSLQLRPAHDDSGREHAEFTKTGDPKYVCNMNMFSGTVKVQ